MARRLAPPLVVLATSAAWILHRRSGPRLDGFTGGPMVLLVPVALALLVAGWLAVRTMLGTRVCWTPLTAAAGASVGTLLAVVLACGPRACFAGEAHRGLGWFLVGGTALAAGGHQALLGRHRARQ